jgi:carboxyl-terminal processing protease
METGTASAGGPNGPSDKTARKYGMGVLVALLVTVSFVAGVFFGELKAPKKQATRRVPTDATKLTNVNSPPPEALEDIDFQAFWNVWKMVKERYVEQPTSDVDMFYGAVAGMVGSLQDPYSVFFDPEFAEKFSNELAGEFEGIGAEIGIKKDLLSVIAPLAGTPAEKAGLQSGDRILAIDGVDTTGMLVEDAVTRIRGPKGTQVKLLITREGLKEPKEVVITRATIVIQSVKWETKTVKGKRIGKIILSHFSENTEAKFNEAVRAILLEDPDALILDLRNNPGGFLDTAVAVGGEWISKDTIVVEKFSDGQSKNYPSDGLARLAHLPTVVLVNGGSASASEIVAGALQDGGKAVLVGEKTFGKGSVQDYVEFDDGSALKLTVALWLTPKGRTINKEGILPDVEVALSPEDYDADKDPQLDKAFETLTTAGAYDKALGAAAARPPEAKTPETEPEKKP